jgi:hypothetical protein
MCFWLFLMEASIRFTAAFAVLAAWGGKICRRFPLHILQWIDNQLYKYLAREVLRFSFMTTSEWLYAQSIITEQALENATTDADRAFWLKRLNELQGRISFEQRLIAKSMPDIAGWEGDYDLHDQ